MTGASIKQFHLPPQISQSLGDIVMQWARLEGLLAEFLTFLLMAKPSYVYVLNQDVASSTQLKWIRTLVEVRVTNDSTKQGLSRLFARIDAVREERNTYVHGVWGPSTEPLAATVQTIKLNRAEIIRTELVTAPDLDEVFDEIASIADELHAVGLAYGFINP
jgi:hypothetical protein